MSLPKYPNEHRLEVSILLAVDQQLGVRPRLGVPVELSDPVGSVEVGQHETWRSSARGGGPIASRCLVFGVRACQVSSSEVGPRF